MQVVHASFLLCCARRLGVSEKHVRDTFDYNEDAYRQAEKKYNLLRNQALEFLKMLKGSGLHILIDLSDGASVKRLHNGLQSVIVNLHTNNNIVTFMQYEMRMEQERYQEETLTEMEKEIVLLFLILMKVEGVRSDFVFRKKGSNGEPNTYLITKRYTHDLFTPGKVVKQADYDKLKEDYDELEVLVEPRWNDDVESNICL